MVDSLDLELSNNDLLVVTGPSGGGKTTFLLSLLKETYTSKGSIDVKGLISYVSAEPYILDGYSIYDNILFGEKF